MGLVTKLEKVSLEKNVAHRKVDCTYSIITDDDGIKYLQLDSYGSISRKHKGKKSQSLRLSPEAVEQLKRILDIEFS